MKNWLKSINWKHVIAAWALGVLKAWLVCKFGVPWSSLVPSL
ncbi:hypothetical protein [Candidatus Poriferisodalis sp.]